MNLLFHNNNLYYNDSLFFTDDRIIINFNLSTDFCICHKKFRKTAEKFIKQIENNIGYYDYYNYRLSEFQSVLSHYQIFSIIKKRNWIEKLSHIH